MVLFFFANCMIRYKHKQKKNQKEDDGEHLMQEENKRANQQHDEHVTSPSLHTRQSLEYLQKQWQALHEPAFTHLQPLIASVIPLPEDYLAKGLTAIAKNLVNGMNLHFLELLAIFQQKAEQEGIDQEEIEGTLADVLPELFSTMMVLSDQVTIHSLDDLMTLSNITLSLCKLSHSETAEKAQRWVYKLPKLYRSQLEQAHLLASTQLQPGASIAMPIMSTQTHLTMTLHTTTIQPTIQQSRLEVTIGSMPTHIINSTLSSDETTLVA